MASSVYAPVSTYAPPQQYVTPYTSNWRGIDYRNPTPENMARLNTEIALRNQQQTLGGIAQDRNEYQSQDQSLYGILAPEYYDMMRGGYGLTDEEKANYLDFDNLDRTFRPEQQFQDWDRDTAAMVDQYERGATATRGAARDYMEALDSDINNMWTRGDAAIAENDPRVYAELEAIREALKADGPWTSGGGLELYAGTGPDGGFGSGWKEEYGGGFGGRYGGGYGGGWSGGAASVGPVDMSGLDLDPEFLAKYKLTPEQKQAWINLNMQGAGARYRAAMEEASRAMDAAGMGNPLAKAAMRQRMERSQGQALDQARLAALVGGENEEDRRLFDIENLRSGNERTRAGINANIATTNAGLQDSALNRSFQAQQAAEARALQAEQAALARAFQAAEAAAARKFQAQMAAAEQAARMEQFYKDLNLRGGQYITDTTKGLGDRQLGWTQYGTDTAIGAHNAGHGANLQNEQRLADSGLAMRGNIAQGTQDIYNSQAAYGLDYSNARAERLGNIYDTDYQRRMAGVTGLQGLQSQARDSRQNTWDQTNAANQIGSNAANQGVGTLAGYKSGKKGPLDYIGQAVGIAGSVGAGFFGGGKKKSGPG